MFDQRETRVQRSGCGYSTTAHDEEAPPCQRGTDAAPSARPYPRCGRTLHVGMSQLRLLRRLLLGHAYVLPSPPLYIAARSL
jgi:hypothetical protein